MRDACMYDSHGIPPQRGAEWVHHNLPNRSRTPLSVGLNPEAPISVYVNHGRWIAECPDCRNAQLACRTDPRFMCDQCGNIAAGKLWRPVVWPADVTGIENLLQNRPVENQNWYPAESKMGLAIENLMRMGRIK